MKVKIFMSSANSMAERDILMAFGEGVERWVSQRVDDRYQQLNITRIGRWENFDIKNQYELDYEYGEAYRDCDVAVIFGSWKPREKGSHATRNSVAANAKRFVVIETPLLNRRTDIENTMWRVGVNGYLNRDALWPQLTPEHSAQRLTDLGISWNGWTNNADGHIVVALQLPGDASLRGADINDWAYRTVKTLRERSNRAIVIRNHPLCSQRAFGDHEALARRLLLDGVQNLRFSDGQIVPWSQDLAGAYCTVTYSSGMAIDSVLRGIPTITCDAGNFAWGFSTQKPKQVEKLERADAAVIQEWLRHLAGCQWSVDEMQTGTAWQYLVPVIESVK
jgi:hypothetical protein